MNQHKPDVRKANPCPPCPHDATAWEKAIYWLGIGLGSGLPQRAAGTWGTLGALILAIPLLARGCWGFLAITGIAALMGSYICGKTAQLMQMHDDPHIVFDEWVGMWISLLGVSYLFFPDGQVVDYFKHTTQPFYDAMSVLVMPFVWFRIFDIVKPFPIKWVDEHVDGGFGILIDDVLAGLMALVAISLSLRYIWL